MKRKLLGGAAHTNGVLWPALPKRTIRRLNSVWMPWPNESSEELLTLKHDTRSVLNCPEPSTLALNAQPPVEVSPAFSTAGFWKPTTVESKVKSPWKAWRLYCGSISVVVTATVKFVAVELTIVTGR